MRLLTDESGATIYYHWDTAAAVRYLDQLLFVPAGGNVHTLYTYAVGSDGASGPQTSQTYQRGGQLFLPIIMRNSAAGQQRIYLPLVER